MTDRREKILKSLSISECEILKTVLNSLDVPEADLVQDMNQIADKIRFVRQRLMQLWALKESFHKIGSILDKHEKGGLNNAT